ncbi:hypothetical protein [Achromobacter spanius]|uniref:hypothetical protein n=2 Tax=Achromobacter spanius TaxID=217203 RepID=UPI000F81B875|nr:hypothetical protein [Achromobacter spanius]
MSPNPDPWQLDRRDPTATRPTATRPSATRLPPACHLEPLTMPHANTPAVRRHRGWRAVGGLALAAVLGLAFWGYTTPDMQLHWENLAALCGF